MEMPEAALTASGATLDDELVDVERTESDRPRSAPNRGICKLVPFGGTSGAEPLAT